VNLRHPNRERSLSSKKLTRRKKQRLGKGWRWLEVACWYCIPGGLRRQVAKLRSAEEEINEDGDLA
jgi:hypothetical protein